jgi:hypothetical protein
MVVQLLAESGASLSITDRLAWTPFLHRAAKVVVTALYERAAVAKLPSSGSSRVTGTVMRMSCPYSAKDIDARDPERWTALHRAGWNGHARVIDLIQNEAETDAKNLERNTSLYHAGDGYTIAVQTLLRHGISVNEVYTDTETALQQAAWPGRFFSNQVQTRNAKSWARSRCTRRPAMSNGQLSCYCLTLRLTCCWRLRMAKQLAPGRTRRTSRRPRALRHASTLAPARASASPQIEETEERPTNQ